MGDNMVRYGFRAVATLDGSALPVPIEKRVASAYSGSEAAATVALRPGDPVRLLADGTVEHAGAGDDIYGVMVAVVGYYDAVKGVMTVGSFVPAGTSYSGLDKATRILVQPARGIVFEADCDDAVTATTEAAYELLVGTNVDHVFDGTTGGNPKIDIATTQTTTAQWRIHEVSKTRENQDFSGANVKLRVVVNEAQLPEFSATGI